MAGRRSRRDPNSVKLTPADAFDLIRWLARSQSDPRKAVAELVQNAIDANARSIVIERRRRGRRAALIVRDDGEGIRPHEDRETALRYIATHIGRSHKRNLSAAERHAQIVAGQYGIGLLGFWSIGHRMEIRSRVGGSAAWLLRLVENEPRAEIVPAPPTIAADETFTELVIGELHATALRPLAVHRLADYLGAELRGPLLASGVSIDVREYDLRGQVVDRAAVTPRRFDGTRLDVPTQLAVPGYPPITVELYQSSVGGVGGGVGGVSVELTCAGTVVVDRIGDLAALGLDVAPWTDPELSGTIEFAALSVPPGTRRGVTPDDSAEAFVAALGQLAPHVQRALDRQREQRNVASERQLVVELRRALRGLRDRMPHLELPSGMTGRGGPGPDRAHDPLGAVEPIARAESPDGGGGDDDRELLTPEPPEPEPSTTDGDDRPLPPRLLPPGPAAHVRLAPDPIRLWPGAARRIRATVTDVHGQQIDATTQWTPSTADLTVEGDGLARTVRLREVAEPGRLSLTVIAEANGGAASCTAEVLVVDGPPAGGAGTGIPEPVLLDDPAGRWRSRMAAGQWQVNVGHPDYRALAGDARARLRYLVALFAKDLTLSATHPGNEPILDQMIDVIALAERNLVRTPR